MKVGVHAYMYGIEILSLETLGKRSVFIYFTDFFGIDITRCEITFRLLQFTFDALNVFIDNGHQFEIPVLKNIKGMGHAHEPKSHDNYLFHKGKIICLLYKCNCCHAK